MKVIYNKNLWEARPDAILWLEPRGLADRSRSAMEERIKNNLKSIPPNEKFYNVPEELHCLMVDQLPNLGNGHTMNQAKKSLVAKGFFGKIGLTTEQETSEWWKKYCDRKNNHEFMVMCDDNNLFTFLHRPGHHTPKNVLTLLKPVDGKKHRMVLVPEERVPNFLVGFVMDQILQHLFSKPDIGQTFLVEFEPNLAGGVKFVRKLCECMATNEIGVYFKETYLTLLLQEPSAATGTPNVPNQQPGFPAGAPSPQQSSTAPGSTAAANSGSVFGTTGVAGNTQQPGFAAPAPNTQPSSVPCAPGTPATTPHVDSAATNAMTPLMQCMIKSEVPITPKDLIDITDSITRMNISEGAKDDAAATLKRTHLYGGLFKGQQENKKYGSPVPPSCPFGNSSNQASGLQGNPLRQKIDFTQGQTGVPGSGGVFAGGSGFFSGQQQSAAQPGFGSPGGFTPNQGGVNPTNPPSTQKPN